MLCECSVFDRFWCKLAIGHFGSLWSEGDVSRWSSRFSWSWVTQVAGWNLITVSDLKQSAVRCKVTSVRCKFGCFHFAMLGERANLYNGIPESPSEVKLRYKWLLLTKKTFSPHGGLMRDEMFLVQDFFLTWCFNNFNMFVVIFVFQFLVELVATCSCPGSSFKLLTQKQCGESISRPCSDIFHRQRVTIIDTGKILFGSLK